MAADWKSRTIGSCLASEFPGEWGAVPTLGNHNALVLRSTNLDDDGHVDKSGGAARRIPAAKLRSKVLRDGDILLEASGGGPGKPVGRVALFDDDGGGPYICSNFFRTLRPGTEVRSSFLAYRLLHLVQQPAIWAFQQQTTGITNLKVKYYLDHELSLPPLPEQRRIAEILDTVDEAIRQTEQVIAKLQQLKQGLLHDLLTRGIDENGELRDPERHPEQFKDSALGRIPAEWILSCVSDEFVITSGMTLGPHRRPNQHPHPYLRVANVHRDRLSLVDIASLEARPIELVGKTLEEGDLLVVEGHANPEEIGRCAMATAAVQSMAFQNHLFRLRPRAVLSEYALQWLNGATVRSYWWRMCSTSSGLNTINRTKLMAVPVLVPPGKEQLRMIEITAACSGRLWEEAAGLAKLRNLKQGLMNDLLTGRVRVPVHEEAAAAL